MYKTLPTLENEKEYQEIKFYEKSLGEFIFSWATKNLEMFYFTCLSGRVLKKQGCTTVTSYNHLCSKKFSGSLEVKMSIFLFTYRLLLLYNFCQEKLI